MKVSSLLKKMRGSFVIFLLTAIIVGVDCYPPAAGMVSADTHATAEIAWVEQSGSVHEIMYSSLRDGKWDNPLQLSQGNLMNLVPALSKGGDGSTYVVWPSVEGSVIFLHYAVIRDHSAAGVPARFETGLTANIGVSLSIDNDGIPWLVWSGNNGAPSDIYYSRWDGDGWQAPQRVHAPNQVPDLHPELIMGADGSVRVEWSTYGTDGYMRVSRELNAPGAPVEPAPAGIDAERSRRKVEGAGCIEHLPPGVTGTARGAMVQRCPGKNTSIQVRLSDHFKR